MKISIIVPVYGKGKYLNKFLERMTRLKSKNYEVVFVVDTNLEKPLEKIEEALPNLTIKYKLIYNSKRIGRSKAVKIGIKKASGDYVMIQSLTNKFDTVQIQELVTEAKLKNTDIIEFKAAISEPIRFKGNLRKNFVRPINIKERKEIIAYSYPIMFNKIFKREVVLDAFKLQAIPKAANSRLSVELLYRIFATAKTYSTIAISPIKTYLVVEGNFNPLDLVKEWDSLINLGIHKNFYQELIYVRYFNDLFFMKAFIHSKRNKVIAAKFKKKMNQIYPKDSNLFTTNKYYLSNNKETKAMKEFRNKSSQKAYKEL